MPSPRRGRARNIEANDKHNNCSSAKHINFFFKRNPALVDELVPRSRPASPWAGHGGREWGGTSRGEGTQETLHGQRARSHPWGQMHKNAPKSCS